MSKMKLLQTKEPTHNNFAAVFDF